MKTFSVTKNGVAISKELYSWNEKTRTFSSTENGLILDFSVIDYVTFKTGNNCIFKTGGYCTFDTGWDCTFDTGGYCAFNVGNDCTFDTGNDCIFKTGSYCTFDTSNNCTFKTGRNCIFKTNNNCIFGTGNDCTFDTGSDCVIVRRDVFEIIQPPPEVTIKLNESGVPGFKEIKPHTITIDGEEIAVSDESFNSLKKSLTKPYFIKPLE